MNNSVYTVCGFSQLCTPTSQFKQKVLKEIVTPSDEITTDFKQDSQCPIRNSKPLPHKYTSRELPTMLQTGRSRVRVPMRWIFFNLPNPSNRTMALGLTPPLNRNEYQDS
jgi:hypothetical protein